MSMFLLLLGLIPLVLELVLVVVVHLRTLGEKCPALPHWKHVLVFLLMFTQFLGILSNRLVSSASSSSPSMSNSSSGKDIKEDKENILVDGLELDFPFEPPMSARL
jgi:hypothetical protein